MLGRACALQFLWSRRLGEDEKDKVAVEEEDEEEMEEEEEQEVVVVVVEEELQESGAKKLSYPRLFCVLCY